MDQAIRKQPINVRFQTGLSSILSDFTNSMTFEAYVKGEINPITVNAVSGQMVGSNTRLQYDSLLDCLQSVVLFNGQVVNSVRIEFVNPSTNTCCSLRIGEGFGDDSSLLIVKELVDDYGFIPYHRLNQALFDCNAMSRLYANCSKCLEDIQVLGFDPNLKYWTGKCSDCNYDSPQNLLLPKRAVSFPEEKFTRIMEVMLKDGSSTELHVELPELKKSYKSKQDFCDTMGSILLWEHTELERIFDVHGDAAELIGASTQFHELQKSMVLKIKVAQSHMWNRQNFKRIGHITVRLHIFREGLVEFSDLCHMKSTNFWLEEDGDEKHCTITFRIDDEELFALYDGSKIMVTPAPSQVLYASSMDVLANLRDAKFPDSLLTCSILGTSTKEKSKAPIAKEYSFFDGMFHLRQSLTEDQVRKVDYAMANNLTIIGNETLVSEMLSLSAAILLSCALEDEENDNLSRVLVIGADEKACSDLSSVLETMVRQFWPCENFLKVLRVFSKIEAIRMRVKDAESGGAIINYLHDQIDTSINEKRPCQVKDQLNIIKSGKYVEMDKREQKCWMKNESKLERNIVRASFNRIIIGTPEALAESQVIFAYSGDTHQFETLFLENANAMTLDKLVPFLSLQRIKRIVINEGNLSSTSMKALTVSGHIAGINKPVTHWLIKT